MPYKLARAGSEIIRPVPGSSPCPWPPPLHTGRAEAGAHLGKGAGAPSWCTGQLLGSILPSSFFFPLSLAEGLCLGVRVRQCLCSLYLAAQWGSIGEPAPQGHCRGDGGFPCPFSQQMKQPNSRKRHLLGMRRRQRSMRGDLCWAGGEETPRYLTDPATARAPAACLQLTETGGRWTMYLSKCFPEKTFSSSHAGLLVLLLLSQQCSLLVGEV